MSRNPVPPQVGGQYVYWLYGSYREDAIAHLALSDQEYQPNALGLEALCGRPLAPSEALPARWHSWRPLVCVACYDALPVTAEDYA